ncbi:MAG: cellulase family glycosylhydrolase, partial [Planctomycetota bacterium]|nr:cellulase family glycosylhydrolase [Planctomycetota bacterium]
MNRREFLITAAGAAVAAGSATLGDPGRARAAEPASGRELARRLPRWRGFNLLEKFTLRRGSRPFVETDFAWMRQWGFDLVRLPMDYRCWTDKNDPYKYDEACLKEIDQAVAFGKKHGVHVSLNLHRAPGFCINPPAEQRNLW